MERCRIRIRRYVFYLYVYVYVYLYVHLYVPPAQWKDAAYVYVGICFAVQAGLVLGGLFVGHVLVGLFFFFVGPGISR